jgi:methyl-accepting chemotaxis protein
MSLRLKALAAALMLLVVSISASALLAYLAMDAEMRQNQEHETAAAVQDARGAIDEVALRMRSRAGLLVRDSALVMAVEQADPSALRRHLVSALGMLREVDAATSILEVTDASGKVLMRGHNPDRSGDSKAGVALYDQARNGQIASGLTVSPATGDASWIAVAPLKNDVGVTVGMLAIGARLDAATAQQLKRSTGLEVVFAYGEKVLTTTFNGRTATDIPNPADIIARAAGNEAKSTRITLFDKPYSASAATFRADTGALLAVVLYRDLSRDVAALRDFVWSFALKSLIMLALFGAMTAFAVGRTTRRITQLAAVTERISGGDYQVEVPGASARDELGMLGRAILVLRDTSARAADLEADAKAARESAADEQKAALMSVADDIERLIGAVSRTLETESEQLGGAARDLETLSEEAGEQTETATEATAATALDVQAVSTASGELTHAIVEIGQQVEQANVITSQASEETRKVTALVDDLGRATQRIGEVVELISAIAAQTNLLALNATIEAARAGEAGRGFAVVAQEVKALAAQTASATSEIGSQISAVQGATQHVVSGMAGVVDSIEQVTHVATSIAAAVQEQNTATEEIARRIAAAADRSRVASAAGGQLNHAVTRVRGQASRLGQSSGAISRETQVLSERVREALTRIRAA